MKLLITGSTGFVGRNLLLHALQDPTWSHIILPVRDEQKWRNQLRNEGIINLPEYLHFCNVDENGWFLDNIPSPDIAIHCAGLTFSRERAPYFETNVESTLRLAQTLPQCCRLLVLSSQSAAGPTPSSVLIRQRLHEDQPLSWYGESKLAMERRLTALQRSPLLILRPPMILGPRDTATIPLFKMARGVLRLKPGMKAKHYSWIDVDDLCRALLTAARSDWKQLSHQHYFLTAEKTITDLELLQTTASVLQGRGITLRAPHVLIRLLSFFADAIPPLRQPLQSLGRDRVKEIMPQRWVVDGSEFRRDFEWTPHASLEQSLQKTATWLEREKGL